VKIGLDKTLRDNDIAVKACVSKNSRIFEIEIIFHQDFEIGLLLVLHNHLKFL
jgi:hypothetical protein